MFCCRLACHDTLEVPQYHRGGGGGSVFVVYLEHVLLSTCLPRHSRSTTVPQFVVYLEHVLLSTCLPRHSRSTTVPQGGAGVVYLLFIWNMFCCRLACHDTLEVPQYHSLLFIWNMFCCRLACHDTLEVPQYHRGGRG